MEDASLIRCRPTNDPRAAVEHRGWTRGAGHPSLGLQLRPRQQGAHEPDIAQGWRVQASESLLSGQVVLPEP